VRKRKNQERFFSAKICKNCTMGLLDRVTRGPVSAGNPSVQLSTLQSDLETRKKPGCVFTSLNAVDGSFLRQKKEGAFEVCTESCREARMGIAKRGKENWSVGR
jgi:hypothetical protein